MRRVRRFRVWLVRAVVCLVALAPSATVSVFAGHGAVDSDPVAVEAWKRDDAATSFLRNPDDEHASADGRAPRIEFSLPSSLVGDRTDLGFDRSTRQERQLVRRTSDHLEWSLDSEAVEMSTTETLRSIEPNPWRIRWTTTFDPLSGAVLPSQSDPVGEDQLTDLHVSTLRVDRQFKDFHFRAGQYEPPEVSEVGTIAASPFRCSRL